MAKGKCLVKECNNIVVSRGLCHACYQRAFLYVKQGKTTWDELIKLGLANAATPRRKGPFVAAFKTAFEKAGKEVPASVEQTIADAKEDMRSIAAEKVPEESKKTPLGIEYWVEGKTKEQAIAEADEDVGLAIKEKLLSKQKAEDQQESGAKIKFLAERPIELLTQAEAKLVDRGTEWHRWNREKIKQQNDQPQITLSAIEDIPEVVQAKKEQAGPSGIPHEEIDRSLLPPIDEITGDPTGDLGTRPRTKPEPSDKVTSIEDAGWRSQLDIPSKPEPRTGPPTAEDVGRAMMERGAPQPPMPGLVYDRGLWLRPTVPNDGLDPAVNWTPVTAKDDLASVLGAWGVRAIEDLPTWCGGTAKHNVTLDKRQFDTPEPQQPRKLTEDEQKRVMAEEDAIWARGVDVSDN